MMNNKLRFSVLAVAITLIIFACGDSFSTVVEIDQPEFKDRLVFFSIAMNNDTAIAYNIGQNRGLLAEGVDNDYLIDDVRVVVSNETTGTTFDSDDGAITFNQGTYFFEDVPSDFFLGGQQYKYQLSHTGFPDSETVLEFPKKGELKDITYKYEDGVDEEWEEASSISFTIVDDPSAENYYELEARAYRQFDTQETQRSFWIFTTDPTATKATHEDNLYFSDETFNGEEKNLTIKFDRWLFNPDEDEHIQLIWRSINKGHFLYTKTLDRALKNGENPFVSPVQVYSNVTDGLGAISFRNEVSYFVTE